ncbi:hypothetical protein ACSBR2_030466 [Camellia fascicularis]
MELTDKCPISSPVGPIGVSCCPPRAHQWVLGYSGKLDAATSIEAEIWAIYRGTTIIDGKGWQWVVIKTDCLDAVQLIHDGTHPNCPYRALAEDIKFLTQKNTKHSLTHLP